MQTDRAVLPPGRVPHIHLLPPGGQNWAIRSLVPPPPAGLEAASTQPFDPPLPPRITSASTVMGSQAETQS
jgi:hypothetical protein